jgi:hypothetical protein
MRILDALEAIAPPILNVPHVVRDPAVATDIDLIGLDARDGGIYEIYDAT